MDSALLMYLWGSLFGALYGAAVSQAEGVSLEAYLGHVRSLVSVAVVRGEKR